MFETFKRSWQLVKASWAVLQADRELMLFPLMSGVAMIITTITFFIPVSIFVSVISGGAEDSGSVLGVVWMFFYYLISYGIVTYFNVALVGAAMIRLDGGDPTVRDGLRIAGERRGKILQYAAISATVGTILQILRERGGIIGNIIGSLGGLAWNLASFFVVPILVVRDISPWEAVKESTSLLKRTWGEQIVAGTGIGFVFTLVFMGVFFLGILLIFAMVSLSESLAIVGVILFILALVAVGIVQSAISGILQAVMFRYVEYGTAPDDFDIETIRGVFKPKNK
jgi:MFS family permease